MNLLLARHGRTFGPHDPVVWLGPGLDPPLTAQGHAQAEHLAQALIALRLQPTAVYCGPSQRTYGYAQTLLEHLCWQLPLSTDPRLDEIDYGDWTGLTQAEVIHRFGTEAFKAWDRYGHWPSNAGWKGSPEAMLLETQRFVQSLLAQHTPDETVLVITSNGRLRYFLALDPPAYQSRQVQGELKVKTGHLCCLHVPRGPNPTLQSWDQDPFQVLGAGLNLTGPAGSQAWP